MDQVDRVARKDIADFLAEHNGPMRDGTERGLQEQTAAEASGQVQRRLLGPHVDIFDCSAIFFQLLEAFLDAFPGRKRFRVAEREKMNPVTLYDLPDQVVSPLQNTAMGRIRNDLGKKKYVHRL